MPQIDGVLFDYGGTLVTFDYPTKALLQVLRDFRPRLEAVLGQEPPAPELILEAVLKPLERYVASTSLDEVDYLAAAGDSWAAAGMRLNDSLLYELIDAEQLCWDRAVVVDPDVQPILHWLGEKGIRRGICSNAPFPPAMMRRQLQGNGILNAVESVVFSSEVGRRKPAPEIYLAALAALGTMPDRTLFVGNKVREDYEGPTALGMSALILRNRCSDEMHDGVPTLESLARLPAVL